MNLYLEMMKHQQVQVLSDRIQNVTDSKPDKRIIKCSECHVEFELPAVVLQIITKGRKEQLDAQTTQISDALSGLRRIPTELQRFQLPYLNPHTNKKTASPASLSLKCYDLDERGPCWIKTHKDLLVRNEILKKYLNRSIAATNIVKPK